MFPLLGNREEPWGRPIPGTHPRLCSSCPPSALSLTQNLQFSGRFDGADADSSLPNAPAVDAWPGRGGSDAPGCGASPSPRPGGARRGWVGKGAKEGSEGGAQGSSGSPRAALGPSARSPWVVPAQLRAALWGFGAWLGPGSDSSDTSPAWGRGSAQLGRAGSLWKRGPTRQEGSAIEKSIWNQNRIKHFISLGGTMQLLGPGWALAAAELAASWQLLALAPCPPSASSAGPAGTGPCLPKRLSDRSKGASHGVSVPSVGLPPRRVPGSRVPTALCGTEPSQPSGRG